MTSPFSLGNTSTNKSGAPISQPAMLVDPGGYSSRPWKNTGQILKLHFLTTGSLPNDWLENGFKRFEDVSPIRNGDFPWPCGSKHWREMVSTTSRKKCNLESLEDS